MNFGDRNPADVLQEPMWQMFKTFGQKANIPALQRAVYKLIGMSTQKTAGQRTEKKTDISWDDNLDMTLWTIVIEACALVLSGELSYKGDEEDCENCEYYDSEEGVCKAFECNGLDCPTLPCEE